MITSYLDCPEHGRQGLVRVRFRGYTDQCWQADLNDGNSVLGQGEVDGVLCPECYAALEYWAFS